MQKRKRLAIAAAILLVVAAAGGTLAWLSATGVLINQFGIGSVEPKVEEALEGGTKSNVRVSNAGTAPAYVRAQVDIYWEDKDGAIVWDDPVKGTDYDITWGDDVASGSTASGASWVKGGDGYYYWTGALAPLEKSGQLIKEVKSKTSADGKRLVVDISAQAVQSTPDDAVSEAWGCTVADGSLVPPSAKSDGE